MVVARAEGAWVEDVEGRRYLDMLAGYSALNFGHRNPALIEAAHRQLDRLTLTSRAFHNDQLAGFAESLAELTGLDMVLPMNTGAEAVESAIKVARKWAYEVKGVAAGPGHHRGGGRQLPRPYDHDRQLLHRRDGPRRASAPSRPGFRIVPYNDLAALEAAIDETTAAVLLEPIQGEAGVLIPDDGYLAGVRELTRRTGCLFIADEIQSGPRAAPARTLAVRPRVGRPRHAAARQGARRRHRAGLGGRRPPGRARGAAPGRARLDLRRQPAGRGGRLGGRRAAGDRRVPAQGGRAGRRAARRADAPWSARASTASGARGLWAGVDIDPSIGTGREISEGLMRRGHPGQGHPRLDDPAGAAADHHGRGTPVGSRALWRKS